MQPILWVAPICIPSIRHGTYGKFICRETRAQGYLTDFIYLRTSRVAHPRFSTLLLLPTTPNLTPSRWPSVPNLKPRVLCGPLGVCFMLCPVPVYQWCAECASVWIPSSRPISVFLNHILVRLHLGFLSRLLLVSRYEVIGALTVDPAELALFEVVDTFIILGVFLFWWWPSGVDYNIINLVLEYI